MAEPSTCVEEALDSADLAVTATWAREPFLFKRHLRPGMHITTLGADQPGKCEVAADALQVAFVVVDDRRLAGEMGAVRGVGLDTEVIHAELGEVLAGKRSGRTDDAQITVFASVGLAFQDLAAGWLVYTLARQQGSAEVSTSSADRFLASAYPSRTACLGQQLVRRDDLAVFAAHVRQRHRVNLFSTSKDAVVVAAGERESRVLDQIGLNPRLPAIRTVASTELLVISPAIARVVIPARRRRCSRSVPINA